MVDIYCNLISFSFKQIFIEKGCEMIDFLAVLCKKSK